LLIIHLRIGTMTVPKEEIEGNIRRAQDDFERLSDLREKLEILTEHVTGRKEALDEEIDESLHAAIQNCKDCLERIAESLEPKLGNLISERLETVQKKMDKLKEENVDAVQAEIEKVSPALLKSLMQQADSMLILKIKSAEEKLASQMKQELETKAQDMRVQLEQKIKLTLLLSMGALTGVFLTLALVLLRG